MPDRSQSRAAMFTLLATIYSRGASAIAWKIPSQV